MIKNIEGIIIASPNATKLANFYKDKVGLKIIFEGVMGEDINVYMMELKGATMTVIDDSKIKGKSKEGPRVMFKFETDNIEKEFAKLKRKKVKVVTPIYHIEDYGYLAKFADADGNHFQLVKTHA